MARGTQDIIDLQVELWNTTNPEIARQLYSEDAERTDPNGREPMRHRGVDEIAKFIAEVRTAFPDFHLDIQEHLSQGDHIALHWKVTGTQKAEFQGLPATGKHVELRGMTLARLRDGRIVSEHVYFDRLSMLEQLGVVSADAAKSGSH
jgi:steroid delta-isomerase-like uncharacterized protein